MTACKNLLVFADNPDQYRSYRATLDILTLGVQPQYVHVSADQSAVRGLRDVVIHVIGDTAKMSHHLKRELNILQKMGRATLKVEKFDG